nr:hypothetical transcript [Hymenolepis microstoma]
MYIPSPHLLVLFFLYALQGVPYGLQSRFLPLVLRSHGASLTSLGFYKLLYIPWILKVCTAFLASFPEIKLVNSTRLLPVTLFIFNFCAATLDIAVDSLAIAQVVGYKFGAVVGGGLLSCLSSVFSLSALFSSLCAFYLTGLWIATTYKGFSEKNLNKAVKVECFKRDNQDYGSVLRAAIFDSPSTPPSWDADGNCRILDWRRGTSFFNCRLLFSCHIAELLWVNVIFYLMFISSPGL